MATIV
jgi:hypothetical protein